MPGAHAQWAADARMQGGVLPRTCAPNSGPGRDRNKRPAIYAGWVGAGGAKRLGLRRRG